MTSLELFRDTVSFLAVHLASFAAFGASAWIFGETLLNRLAIGHMRERWALAATLGWGLIAQAMFFLGLLRLFERWIVLGLLILGHLICYRTWRSVRAVDIGARGRLVLGGLIAAPCLAFTLYPPIGFDATVYHLPYARAFVDAGGLEFLPDLRFPVFPQAAEMGFVLGFFLSGEIAAKLSQLLVMLLTAGLLMAWGRLYDRRAGIWATALWLGNPLIVWLGASAYIDLTLALFVTASFVCWEHWIRDADRRWLWLAGAFCGLAAATKYLGLFFLAALVVMTAVRGLRLAAGGGASRVRVHGIAPAIVLGAVALAVLAPWYLRIVYHTGSPLFPFYAPIFGDSEWASLHDQTLPAARSESGLGTLFSVAASQGARIAEGLLFLIKVPWTAVFDRGIFHWQAPLSPYYLLLLPLCAPIAVLEKRIRWLVLLVALYSLFWLTTVRDLRFLVAAMPVLNVALTAALAGSNLLTPVLKRWATPLLAGILLVPGPLYAGYKIRKQGWPPITADQRTAYLARQVDGFEAIARMNELAGRDYTVYTLYGENLRYYADGRFLGDWFGPARYALIEARLDDAEEFVDELADLGACFFLVRHPRPRQLMPADLSRFREVTAGEGFVLYRLPEIPCSRDTDKLRTIRSFPSLGS